MLNCVIGIGFGLTDIIIGLPIIIIVAILKLKLDKYVESLKSEDDN